MEKVGIIAFLLLCSCSPKYIERTRTVSFRDTVLVTKERRVIDTLSRDIFVRDTVTLENTKVVIRLVPTPSGAAVTATCKPDTIRVPLPTYHEREKIVEKESTLWQWIAFGLLVVLLVVLPKALAR
jgi:hypothetical protein